MRSNHYISLHAAIKDAIQFGTLLDVTGLEGFSGKKLLGLLQRCAQYQDWRDHGVYLEVGVFKGLSLISVASVLENTHAFGVDNFSQFDAEGINRKTVESQFKQNQLTNAQIIDLDYEVALENLSDHIGENKVATYFVDGPHDYRSQMVCLNLAKPFLSENAVIIIDDCNYEHVRMANRDFLIANQEYKLFFEAYTASHPNNMTNTELQTARDGWWNGVNVIVRDVDDELKKQYPPTRKSRRLYENEHLIQAHKFGALGVETLSLLMLLDPLRPRELYRALKSLRRKVKHLDGELRGQFPRANTFSDQITGCQFNETLKEIETDFETI